MQGSAVKSGTLEPFNDTEEKWRIAHEKAVAAEAAVAEHLGYVSDATMINAIARRLDGQDTELVDALRRRMAV